jgi:ClpP class serine protease
MMETGELMNDVGSVIDGEAAVREGLIDNLGGLAEAIDCLYDMIENYSQKAVSPDVSDSN